MTTPMKKTTPQRKKKVYEYEVWMETGFITQKVRATNGWRARKTAEKLNPGWNATQAVRLPHVPTNPKEGK